MEHTNDKMSITLTCYFPIERPFFGQVQISLDDTVSDLFERIISDSWRHRVREQGSRKIAYHVFKADLPVRPNETLQLRALQWLHLQPLKSQLDPAVWLSEVFPEGPHGPHDDKLDIIVASTEVLEWANNLEDPYYLYNTKVKKALNKCLDARLSLPSLSEVVKDPRTMDQIFGAEESRIHIDRPGGVPAVIFHPVLAALQQDLDHLERIEVAPRDISRASDYIMVATRFYEYEDQRRDAIEELTRITMSYWGPRSLPILIFKLKNEPGLEGDALSQAVVAYNEMITSKEFKHFREYTNFPVVLIGATANRLEIAVAVSIGSIHVTELLTLNLSLGFHASANIICLARVFDALSRCYEELEKYYTSVTNFELPALSCLFPNPTPLDPSITLPNVTYRQFFSREGLPTWDPIDLGATTTALYIALLDGKEVIVKFTARYNEAAHRLLADAQLAPELHFCGLVVGNLYMIVMERVSATSIWQLQQKKKRIPQIVREKVTEAVHLLHAQDIVFGDLRPNNILYTQSDDEDRVVLVDFDWAAKDGEGRYPATLNPASIWHDDVGPYGIMCKDHDLWQLSRLKDIWT